MGPLGCTCSEMPVRNRGVTDVRAPAVHLEVRRTAPRASPAEPAVTCEGCVCRAVERTVPSGAGQQVFGRSEGLGGGMVRGRSRGRGGLRMLPVPMMRSAATRTAGCAAALDGWPSSVQQPSACRISAFSTDSGGGDAKPKGGKVPPPKQRLLDVMLSAQTGGWVRKKLGLETYAPPQPRCPCPCPCPCLHACRLCG